MGNLTSLGSGSYDYSSWHTNCGTPPSQPFPHAVRKVGSSDYFCYDSNGNMITRKLGSTTYSHSYDVENRLTEVTANTNSTVTQFSYDSQGQRTSSDVETPGVSKTVTHYPFPTYQEETRYLWQYHCEGGDEGSRCDYKWVEQAVVKKSNYFLAGQAIATRITGDPVSGNNGLFYFLTDYLGSTTMLITAAGAAVAGTAAYYQPYGSGRTSPPTTLTERGYTGHHENRDIGLTYMNTRYYIPGLGRFLTADTLVPSPTNPQSHNRYTYVLGNPLILVDPTGHYSCYTHGQNEHCTDALPPPSNSYLRYSEGLEWWRTMLTQRRYYVEGYGLFDIGHIERGFLAGLDILGQVREAVASGEGYVIYTSAGSYGFDDYERVYWVSGNLTEEEIIGVALAIYMDFEMGYETLQSGRGDFFSAYSLEDLPSDYLGFWAAVNGYTVDQIPYLLGQLGRVTPYHGSSLVFGWEVSWSIYGFITYPTIPRNYEFKPMARIGRTWRHVDWPEYMHLTPVNSSPTTWIPIR